MAKYVCNKIVAFVFFMVPVCRKAANCVRFALKVALGVLAVMTCPIWLPIILTADAPKFEGEHNNVEHRNLLHSAA